MTRRRRPILSAFLVGLVGVCLSVGQAAAAGTVIWERDLTADLLNYAYPYDNAFEPMVATHPFNSQRLAVAFNYRPSSSPCSVIIPGLRFSTDGGSTWVSAARRPWAGSGRIPNYHAVIAYGPGPTAGSARLYWADTTVGDCTFTGHRLSITYSDDRGATWAPLRTFAGNAQHGYPDLVVDRNQQSPNYGAVYVTINPFDDSVEPGLRVFASKDFGVHWQTANVAALPSKAGYPFKYRNGYRLRTAPDGGLYASFCQVDRLSATSGGFGRVAYGIARLELNRAAGTFTAAAPVLASVLHANGYTLQFNFAPGTSDRQRLYVCWTHGIDVDQSSGRVYLALPDYVKDPADASPRGFVLLGRSDDLGQTWSWQQLPALAADNSGRQQSAHKPTVLARGGTVFVGFHVLTDVPLDSALDPTVTVGNAYVVSTDGGDTWDTPRLVSSARWNPGWLDLAKNGAGLRDRAEFTAGGRVFWAYGDGRRARAKPDARWGRGQVYATLIDVSIAP